MERNRVVVTGMGAITPIGLSVPEYWEALCAGYSGVARIAAFDTEALPVKVGSEVKGFDPTNYLDAKQARRTGRFIQFGLAATQEAIQQAELDLSKEAPHRVGVVIGSTGGVFEMGPQWVNLQEHGYRRVDPFINTRNSAHMSPAYIARVLGVKGPNTNNNTACASGNDAIGLACNFLRLGQAEVMLAGGTEAILTPLGVAYLGLVGALTREDDPEIACRPFDANRSGFVLGEGAGVLVLETEEHARRRGAPILAELAGAGWSFDAYDDTAPDPQGQALAMQAALADAGLSPGDIQYVNAHGTSTKLNDAAETKALKLVFGERAWKIPVSSNKSMIGHLSAAAGAVESVATILTLRHGILPPTIHYETADPECDLDYVPNQARAAEVQAALCDSFGLGGQNVCLVWRRYEEAT